VTCAAVLRLVLLSSLVGACTLAPLPVKTAPDDSQAEDVQADSSGSTDVAEVPDVPVDVATEDTVPASGCPEACPAWKTCQGQECVAKACTSDGACNESPLPADTAKHFCFHKTCQAFQCGADADCATGQKCNTLTYLCYAPPTGCTWDGSCVDADDCTDDRCDLPSGKCTHSPVPGCCKGAADCDDKLACTTDSCVAGECQHLGKSGCCQGAGDCADGNPCTTDACQGGQCLFTAVAACCQGDGACDDDDTASLDQCWKNACIHQWQGVPQTCGADADCKGNACLKGSCHSGKCSYAAGASCCKDDASCIKNVACQVDVCTAGVCAASPAVGVGTHVWAHFDTLALDNWTVDKQGTVQAWFHESTLGSIAGPGALRFGVPGQASYDTSTVAKGTATSPALAIPKSGAKLKFWLYLDVEPGTAVDTCGIDVVAGGKATTVWSKNANLGGGTTGQAWKEQAGDLAAWAGQSVQIRVWFDQKVHDTASKAKLGLVLDELEVLGACP
jgi:hypothetical protein